MGPKKETKTTDLIDRRVQTPTSKGKPGGTKQKKKKKKKNDINSPKKVTNPPKNPGNTQARKYLPLLHTLTDTPANPRRDLLSRLHPQCLSYIITALTHILQKKRGYHVSEREAQWVRSVLKPHATKPAYKLITQPNKGKQIQQQIYKQNGRGIFLSALLSAAIPLIASVIRRFENKKNNAY